MKLRRLSAISLAAALMATSTAIVAGADDTYVTNGTIEYSDFGAQIYGMGTTNWSWVNGAGGGFEAGEDKGTLELKTNGADLNNKGDDTVQFGIQFYLSTDSKGEGELAIGDSYTCTVTYTLASANGTISENTVEVSKKVEKNQWGAGIDGTFTLYSADVAKADLEGYGEVTASLTISNVEVTKDGKTLKVGDSLTGAADTTEEGTAEETKAEEAKPEDTTAVEETKAEEATEEPTEEYVSTFDPSSVKLNDTITDKYFDNGYLYLRDENGLDALDKGEGLDIMTVYGVRFILDYDEKDIENGIWFGGGIGANSNSTGWKQFGWSYTEGEQDLTMDLETKSITWLSDAPVFAADDTYCQLWIQSWGGNWGVKEAQMLDKDGNVISFEGNADVAEEPTPAEPAPVEETASAVDAGTATAGDTTAATNSSKGSPNTGIADVAAIAGIAVAAAGAVVLTKKRK